MCGAAILSARAAYRSGAGYVRIYTDEHNQSALFQSIPEAVVSCIHSNWKRELENLLAWADVVAVGPGIGMEAQKLDILNYVLEHADIPVILDADALNLVARHNLSLDGYSMPVAVTPHLGEMARLCRSTISDISEDLIASAEIFAKETTCDLCLKGCRNRCQQRQ